MRRVRPVRHLITIATAWLFVLATTSQRGQAGTFDWDNGGGDGFWATGANWDANAPAGGPLAVDFITFNGPTPLVATIDLAGTRNVRGITFDNGTSDYVFQNTASGALILNSVSALESSLVFGAGNTTAFDVRVEADVLLNPSVLNGTLLFNHQAAGTGSILVAGDVSLSDTTLGETTLMLTSRANATTVPEAVKITGNISDGLNGVVRLTAGFDAVDHFGQVAVTGDNTFTGRVVVNGATLAFDSIADGNSIAPNALGTPTVANRVIDLGLTTAPAKLRYIGDAGTGHASNRAINLTGTTGTVSLEAAGATTSDTLTLSGNFLATGAGAKTLQLTGANTGNNTISGIIPNTSGGQVVSVEKIGTGTWVLDGDNSYTGNTTVRAGTLKLGGDERINNAASMVVEGSAATVDLNGFTETVNSFVFNGGTVQNGTVIAGAGNFVVGASIAPTTVSAKLSGTARLFHNNQTTAVVSLTNDANDFTGRTDIDRGIVEITSLANLGQVSSLGAPTTSANGQIKLGTGFDATLRYVGSNPAGHASNREILVGAALNAASFIEASGAGPLTLSGPLLTTANNSQFAVFSGTNTDDNTYSGVVNGVSGGHVLSVRKEGSGTWLLSGTNLYDGSTQVFDGTLKLSGGSAVPNASAVTMFAGTLDLTGSTEVVGDLIIEGNSLIHNGTIASPSTVDVNLASGEAATISAILSGIGGLAKHRVNTATDETGVLSLTGLNTFTGKTLIEGGILEVNKLADAGQPSSLGAATGAIATIDIGLSFNDGTLRYVGSGDATNRPIHLAGDNSGNAILESSGTGPLVFTASSFTVGGTTNPNAKTLVLRGTNAGANEIQSVIPNGAGVAVTSVIKSFGGTWVLSGANSYIGGTTIFDGVLSVGSDANLGSTASDVTIDGGTLRITGSTFSGIPLASNRDVIWGAAGGGFDIVDPALTFSVENDLTGGSLTKSGAGTLRLTGANTYTGNTQLNGGALEVDADNRLGAAGTSLMFDGGTLRVAGETFQSTSRTILPLGAGGATFDIEDADNTFTVNQALSGGGALTKSGAGQLRLGGANSYVGDTLVDGGTLSATASNVIPDGSSVVVYGLALLQLNGFTDVIDGLDGGGAVALGAGTLEVGSAGSGGLYTGAISGSGSLVKSGSGRQILTGPNSYSGTTEIIGGVLEVRNALATPGSPIDIQVAGTLEAEGVLQRAVTGAGTLRAIGASLVVGNPASTAGVDFDGALDVAGGFVGLMDADEAVLGPNSVVTLAGGRLATFNGLDLQGALSGSGIVTGSGLFSNAGVVAPGDSAGLLSIAADYSQLAQGTLRIEIGGAVPAVGYDQLLISGAADLDGTLSIEWTGAFVPSAGDVLRIIDYDSHVGSFSTVSGQVFGSGAGQFVEPVYRADHLSLYVPLPGDANFDGLVSGGDFTIWGDHFGQSGFATPIAGWAAGDFSGDNTVTGADFTLWADHFGQSVALGSVAIPEPRGWLLVLAALPLVVRRRHRSRAITITTPSRARTPC